MEFLTETETIGFPPAPGVTSINDLKNQKRASKTLSKAVSLHLEGKLEGAARLLAKAIESGEKDGALYSALGHVQCEMHDYEAAAATYAQLGELEPEHRTAHINRGV
jgi:Flp pilus assembly protein TadD